LLDSLLQERLRRIEDDFLSVRKPGESNH